MYQEEYNETRIYSVQQYCIHMTVKKNIGTKYNCNGKYFSTFDSAFQYIHSLNRKNPQRYPIKKVNPYKDFNIKQYLGTNLPSLYIWKYLWGKCDYMCYSFNNFEVLKNKYIDEINLLRNYHRVNPLVKDEKLMRLAQKHAERMARTGRLLSLSRLLPFGETFGATFYLAGNTLVNKWYQEIKYYSYANAKSLKNFKMFTQIVWKNSKLIGVGVVRKNQILYVVFRFYPKGNVKNKFNANVNRPRAF